MVGCKLFGMHNIRDIWNGLLIQRRGKDDNRAEMAIIRRDREDGDYMNVILDE